MNLEKWTSMVKRVGSKYTRNEIKGIIKSECLNSNKKILGAYQISGEKIWHRLIENDPNCQEALEENKIKDWLDLESWSAQIEHQKKWRYWKHVYRKTKR